MSLLHTTCPSGFTSKPCRSVLSVFRHASLKALFFCGLAFGAAVTPGLLDTGGRAAAQQPEGRDQLQIQQGTAEVMTAPYEYATMVIGNDAIVQVSAVDANTIALTGLAVGQTNLLVLDENGLVQFEWDIRVLPPRTGGPVVYRAGRMEMLTCNPICVPSATGPGPGLEAAAPANGAAGANAGANAAAPAAPQQ